MTGILFEPSRDFVEQIMRKCISLAKQGLGNTYPNPLVGSVIIKDDRIIGQGFHSRAGLAHAEVEAIHSVENSELLKNSTLIVNLEPCNHFGKTPPCTHLIINSGIKKVIIGMPDPYPKVNGKGIKKLIENGIEVECGILKKECENLNRRYLTSIKKSRPYVILKWAQSADGYFAPPKSLRNKSQPYWLTGNSTQRLVHKWRSEEESILVGVQTIIDDNPELTVRLLDGPHRNPVRIILDPNLRTPQNAKVMSTEAQTILISNKKAEYLDNHVKVLNLKSQYNRSLITSLMEILHSENIQSVLVEGGKKTLQSFIDSSKWDEARILTAPKQLNGGIKAPVLDSGKIKINQFFVQNDKIEVYRNSN